MLLRRRFQLRRRRTLHQLQLMRVLLLALAQPLGSSSSSFLHFGSKARAVGFNRAVPAGGIVGWTKEEWGCIKWGKGVFIMAGNKVAEQGERAAATHCSRSASMYLIAS